MRPNDWLRFLDALADRADEIALDLFRSATLRVEIKADRTPVSEADRRIETMARTLAADRHPGLGVFGEEEGEDPGSSETRLIIDPIDATFNFVRGIPVFATLLAIESDGELTAGVVSAPALEARWRAARGAGAFLGAERIRVSTVSRIGESQVFHGDVAGTRETLPPRQAGALVGRVARARGFGDFLQHVLVAQGSGEAALDPALSPWDAAPLLLIVEEAGGRATTMTGERTIYGGSLVTSNGLLHEEFLQVLRPEV